MSSIITAPAHTKEAFDISTMPLIVKWAEDLIYRHKADAIVACGHSGLVIAGALSYVTRVPVFAVRKHDEGTVASPNRVTAVSPNGAAKRWVWIDDFLSSGGTFRRSARILSYNRTREFADYYNTRGGDLQLVEDYPTVTFHPTVPHYGFKDKW